MSLQGHLLHLLESSQAFPQQRPCWKLQSQIPSSSWTGVQGSGAGTNLQVVMHIITPWLSAMPCGLKKKKRRQSQWTVKAGQHGESPPGQFFMAFFIVKLDLTAVKAATAAASFLGPFGMDLKLRSFFLPYCLLCFSRTLTSCSFAFRLVIPKRSWLIRAKSAGFRRPISIYFSSDTRVWVIQQWHKVTEFMSHVSCDSFA